MEDTENVMHSFAILLLRRPITYNTCLIYTFGELYFFLILCQNTPSQPKTQRSVNYDRLSEVFWQASHLCEPDVVTKSVLILTDVEQIEVFNCVCSVSGSVSILKTVSRKAQSALTRSPAIFQTLLLWTTQVNLRHLDTHLASPVYQPGERTCRMLEGTHSKAKCQQGQEKAGIPEWKGAVFRMWRMDPLRGETGRLKRRAMPSVGDKTLGKYFHSMCEQSWEEDEKMRKGAVSKILHSTMTAP